jgi:NADH dehydrogenase FAD-containing subunit
MTKITSSILLPDKQHELKLSSGETILADMYIPTFGLTPNSSYVPSQFLDSRGYVTVNAYLEVVGKNANAENVWAIGDVSALEPPQLLVTEKQSAHLAKNIVALLSGKKQTLYNPLSPSRYQISLSCFA